MEHKPLIRTLIYISLSAMMISMPLQSLASTEKSSHNKIVSLSPHITEILFDIGAGGQVVGTPAYSTHPTGASSVSVIGDFLNPSIEKIVSLRPDLILGSKASVRPELIAKLKQLGYHVELVDEKDLNDIYDSIITIGELMNREKKAKELATSMQNRIKELENKIPATQYKKVFYQIWEKPIMTAGSDSYITDILNKAHLISISANQKGYPAYSIEKIIKEDPDIILISYDDTAKIPKEEPIQTWKKYKQLKAVKNDAIYIIDAQNINIPSPRLIDGYAEIIEKVWNIDTK